MAKSTKRNLLVFVLAALLSLCIAVFAACTTTPDNSTPNGPGPDDNSTVEYTVEVKLAEGGAAVGTKVTVKQPGVEFGSKTVDAAGKATFSLASGEYTVELTELPAHYELPADAALKLTAASNSTSVTLVRKFAYEVSFADVENNPITSLTGLTVQICTVESNNCLEPVAVENGVALLEDKEKTEYHVKVNNLPADYVYECDDDGYYLGGNLTAEVTKLAVKLHRIDVIDITKDFLSDAEKTAYSEVNMSYYGNELKRDAKKVTKSIKPGESAYYVISPRYSGTFTLYTNDNATYQKIGTAFALENGAGNLYGQAPELNITVGKPYYFRVYNNGDAAVNSEFVLALPAASKAAVEGVGAISKKATADVTISKAEACAVIEFHAKDLGAYKATVQGDQSAYIESMQYVSGTFDAYDADAAFAKNASATYKATAESITYFVVSVPANATYPVSLKVEIEKIHEFTNTTTVAEVTETLVQFADADEDQELVGVPMDGTATLVYNNTDKYYHLGTEDGPVVVVMLTECVDDARFDCAYEPAYLDMDTQRGLSFVFDVTSDADKADLTKGNTYKDYRTMLRGFGDYDYDKQNNPVRPAPTAQTYYTKYVNADGVYPLTKELKEFLEKFCEVYQYNTSFSWMIVDMTVEPENFWLFPLYYYEEPGEEPIQSDEIVGEYKFVKHIGMDGSEEKKQIADDDGNISYVSFSEDDFKLVVNKNGTWAIYAYDSESGLYEVDDVASGTWSKTETAYAFIENSFINIYYTATIDATAGVIKLVCDDEEEQTEWHFKLPTPDPIIGEYKDADGITLTVKADGTYTMVETMGTSHGTWVKGEAFYIFTDNNFPDAPYEVEINEEDESLTFFDPTSENPAASVFEFNKVGGEEAEPETTLMSQEQIVNNPAAKLELYEDGTFKFYTAAKSSLNLGSYDIAAEGTYAVNEETGAVTITITNSYDATINATFNNGVITVKYTTGEEPTENNYATYTFNMFGSNPGPDVPVPQPTPIPTPDVTPQTVPSSTGTGKLVLYDDQVNHVGVFKLFVGNEETLYADGNWGANGQGDITISNLQAFNGATVEHSYNKANNFTLTVTITYSDNTTVTLTFSFAPLFMPPQGNN